MKRVFIEVAVILAISLVLGILNNTFSHSRVAWIGSWPSFSDSESDSIWDCLSCEEGDPPSLRLSEVSALYQNPEVVFLDARFPEEYEDGHIKGAYLVPFEADEEEFQYYFDIVSEILQPSSMIVTYCSGAECESSLFLARYLRDELGYDSVKIFFGGWRRWEKAGLPVSYPGKEGGE